MSFLPSVTWTAPLVGRLAPPGGSGSYKQTWWLTRACNLPKQSVLPLNRKECRECILQTSWQSDILQTKDDRFARKLYFWALSVWCLAFWAFGFPPSPSTLFLLQYKEKIAAPAFSKQLKICNVSTCDPVVGGFFDQLSIILVKHWVRDKHDMLNLTFDLQKTWFNNYIHCVTKLVSAASMLKTTAVFPFLQSNTPGMETNYNSFPILGPF